MRLGTLQRGKSGDLARAERGGGSPSGAGRLGGQEAGRLAAPGRTRGRGRAGAGKEARPAHRAPGPGGFRARLPPRSRARARRRGGGGRPGADPERRRVCARPPPRARLLPPRVTRRPSARTSSIRPDRPPAPRPSIKPGGARRAGAGTRGPGARGPLPGPGGSSASAAAARRRLPEALRRGEPLRWCCSPCSPRAGPQQARGA